MFVHISGEINKVRKIIFTYFVKMLFNCNLINPVTSIYIEVYLEHIYAIVCFTIYAEFLLYNFLTNFIQCTGLLPTVVTTGLLQAVVTTG